MNDPTPKCVHCGQTSEKVPLLRLEYRGESYWICPAHFPILIHKPQDLVGKLPGAENLTPHEH